MTTLTPEKALERLVVHTAMEDAAVAMECEAILKPVLATLSTERQAREAAESDAENLAHRLVTTLNRAEDAEKEVERLEAECIQKCINCQVAWEAKLAALSALHPPVGVEGEVFSSLGASRAPSSASAGVAETPFKRTACLSMPPSPLERWYGEMLAILYRGATR